MPDQMTCGQALVKLLEKYGVDTVFGIPGVHTLRCIAASPTAISGMCWRAMNRERGSWPMAVLA